MLKSPCETRMESGGALALRDLGGALTQEEGGLGMVPHSLGA